MTTSASQNVVFVGEETVRFRAELSLEEIAPHLGDHEFLVEPLDERKPFADFLQEGGIGYYSLHEGSFAASVCRVKTDRFDYGCDFQTLYNVGYPLQRLVEFSPHELCPVPLGKILEITAFVRPRRKLRLVASGETLEGFETPPEAVDAFYTNAVAARRLGLDSAGWVSVIPEGFTAESAGRPFETWETRFFEGKIAADQQVIKVLTQKSALPRIYERAQLAEGLFFALLTHLGVLVVLAAKRGTLDSIASEILALPLTYNLSRR